MATVTLPLLWMRLPRLPWAVQPRVRELPIENVVAPSPSLLDYPSAYKLALAFEV
jgi:hypothetical protein